MKEIIRQALEKEPQAAFRKLKLAEILQHLILQSLYRQGFFGHLVFTGGTALRLLYHTNRFSEDLDFSLMKKKGFRFRPFLERVQKDLLLQRLGFDFYPKEEKNVAQAQIRFPDLLQEFKLTPLKDQKLMIKIEVDTHPPDGGTVELALVTSPFSYTVSVFDLPSLFATKLHAIFFRRYVKGRDYYDLMWYLGKRVRPNFALLNNAIRQTEGKGNEIREDQLKEKLTARLGKVDFAKIRAEVGRFLIRREELKFLDRQPIESLLRNY